MSSTITEPRRYDHLIDGVAVASSADRLERRDPATGRLVAEYAHGGQDEVDRAVAAARQAFDDGPWPRLSGADRARLLRRFASLVERDCERLAQLDSQEVGKPISIARGEIDGAVGHIEYAASLAHTERGDAWTTLDTDFVAYASQVPLGVAALVVPWNFPALILAQKLPYALAAGCTAVIKPSEFTSSSAVEMVRLAHEAGIPTGAVNLVTGLGPTTGQALTSHPDVDVVSFTGSTQTGRLVASDAGRNLKRVGLELGGKAANVVFADADLDRAADAAVYAAFINQGECCVSGARLLVQRSIADEFVAEVARRTRTLQVGSPADETTDIGPLIHGQHLERVLGYVTAGEQSGATAITGGGRLTDDGLGDGWFVAPTIFTGVAPSDRIFQEEIFGPVLSVVEFDDADDAVRLGNDTVYGLANALWTNDIATAHRVGARLRSGTVWVNTNVDGAPALAFGGTKDSGIGREVGHEGLAEFTESKTIQIRSGDRKLPFPRRNGGVA